MTDDSAAEAAWQTWYASYAGQGDNAARWTAAIILRKAFLAGYAASQASGTITISARSMMSVDGRRILDAMRRQQP